ncbi:MAG TPA: DUF763 domain-containing protein [Candidatus Nanoarchaeia archaeon]|nr:DUF763 domain-containing protein [Candidatus Nanoarchaeia archaeon]
MKRGIATFTLDHGHCPPWLFERMVKLGREMTRVLIEEYGPDEYIARIGDPVWFQSLGTVLAFDWNASGLTTILTAALKEAIRGQEKDFGVFIAGGKGKTSRKTPEQIHEWAHRLSLPDAQANNLEYNSRMSAKVDSALVQDGYELYHHAFFFSQNGAWTVVQQGMNQTTKSARRYHWHSQNVQDLIVEPHSGIAAQQQHKQTLNLTASAGQANRDLSLQLVESGYERIARDFQLLAKHSNATSRMVKVAEGEDQLTLLQLRRGEFEHHPVEIEDFTKSRYLQKILNAVSEDAPKNYEKLLSTKGVGGKTMRSLSLVSEVIYGAKASYQDPARYSFAHGGKDATPYPVDKPTYDQTIAILKSAVGRSRLDLVDKTKAIQKLDEKLERDHQKTAQ